MSNLPLLFNIGLVIIASMRQEKEFKDMIEKENIKLSLFVDYMIIFRNSKNVAKKLLELISEFSKMRDIVSIYKIPS